MASGEARISTFEQRDESGEFERQPVAPDRLCSGTPLASVFTGEYLGAMEFVIGAVLVAGGARTFDVLVGLLVGNLLAVLCWALICAPIAVRTRLTLYWYLRRIAGPAVTVLYNVLHAALCCIVAGAMITLAASAARLPFGIRPQTGWLPTDAGFVVLALVLGVLVIIVAGLGFRRLAQLAGLCAPWMVAMFVAGALIMLPTLGHVSRWRGFFLVAEEWVWTGDLPAFKSMTKEEGRLVLHFDRAGDALTSAGGTLAGFAVASQPNAPDDQFVPAEARIDGPTLVITSPELKDPAVVRYQAPATRQGTLCNARLVPIPSFRTDQPEAAPRMGFWHIVAFAWVCNLIMHLGLGDMALLRFARRSAYGLYSAFGMYLGHYLGWICAGIMGGAAVKMLSTPMVFLDSGEVAFAALGWMGVLAVVLAGWTTANPALYRAGLALQAASPGWPRWRLTALAGALTALVACFPMVFRHLVDLVALFGVLLAPVGAIVVMEHWVFPRLGWTQFWSARKGQVVNVPALLAWAASVAAALYAWHTGLMHLVFLAAPVWLLAAVVYGLLSALAGARQALPELAEQLGAGWPDSTEPPPAATQATPRNPRWAIYFGGLAVVCLGLCVFLSLSVFLGYLTTEHAQQYLVYTSAAYFVAGVLYLFQRRN